MSQTVNAIFIKRKTTCLAILPLTIN